MFFCPLSFAFAQRQLSGTVLDKRDSKPVAGASVSIGLETLKTAQDGTFTIGNAPERGRVTLSVSAPGYQSLVLTVKDFENGLYFLDASAAEDDFPVFELDGDEEMGYGGQTVSGLATSSEDVFDRNAGYNLSFSYFRPRGYDNQNSSVYINGALMNDPENGLLVGMGRIERCHPEQRDGQRPEAEQFQFRQCGRCREHRHAGFIHAQAAQVHLFAQ